MLMSIEPMKATRVVITLSDPWDLGEALGWQPIEGEFVRFDVECERGQALIKLRKPISYRGTSCGFLAAVPRHEDGSFKTIQKGCKLFCSFTGIANEAAHFNHDFSTAEWRGGLAFIGDLEIGA